MWETDLIELGRIRVEKLQMGEVVLEEAENSFHFTEVVATTLWRATEFVNSDACKTAMTWYPSWFLWG